MTAREEPLVVGPNTRVRRLSDRQTTDRAILYEILDSALVAHVAVVRDGLPVVIPFACARDGNALLLHGSTGAGVMRLVAGGAPVSVAVTLTDALVVARSVFDHSLNYRSMVAFGVPEVLDGEAKVAALRVLTDHLLPGRWDEVRPSTAKELAATMVLRLPLDDVSVKVRAAGPSTAQDDGEDRSVWAGLIPLTTVPGEPVGHVDVPAGVEIPPSVTAQATRLRRQAQQVTARTRTALTST